MQIKEGTFIQLFPISCMLSSMSIGQETSFFSFIVLHIVLFYIPKASCEKIGEAEGELESQ